MTFRVRVLLAFGPVVLVPLLVFGLGVRRVVREQVTGQFEERVETLAGVIRDDVTDAGEAVADRLRTLREALLKDNRFRLAAVQGASAERQYLLDYASTAMPLAGLDMLQIQDEAGRILSSGHFRNEYDRREPGLPRALAAAPGGVALVTARRPEEPFLVLARVDTLRLGGRAFTLVGGLDFERRVLSGLPPDPELRVTIVTPEGTSGGTAADDPASSVLAELELPYVGRGGATARVVVSHALASLGALRRGLDFWFLAAVLASAAVALVLAGWLASRVSRPLTELAERTAELDLDRLDARFESRRTDEIGTLTGVLGAMTARLKAGAARLREYERRAAMGDLARQVNHDIKNGLAPIRNVFRHFAEVAQLRPSDLPRVFAERQGTVESSIGYLESLSANYARLYPETAARPVDVNAVVSETLRHVSPPGHVTLTADLAPALPPVRGDALVIRRILENLVGNAVDALDGTAGTVTVATGLVEEGPAGHGLVRIAVIDTGRGMSKAELDRAFDDFYTTKPGGTGLGLSIVRRLVLDLEGRLRVETEPGMGTKFIVELPSTG